MEAEHSGRRNSNVELLEELEVLSHSLYQTHRRTSSLHLHPQRPTSSSVEQPIVHDKNEKKPERPNQSRRMSISPWRSKTKPAEQENEQRDGGKEVLVGRNEVKMSDEKMGLHEKRGVWNWKPIRALAHIGMQRLNCLFSVDVVSVHGLSASMNGLRLSVCVRKKETKQGSVQTMPTRVLQGAADFDETLYFKCHVYCTTGSGKQLKFESRPFVIYVFAVDARELDFGKSSVDLSLLVQESMEKSLDGSRVRQWTASYNLSGKAQGGELVLKLGFQIIGKQGGLEIYNQDDGLRTGRSSRFSLSSFAPKHSKSSFSVPSQRMTIKMENLMPSNAGKGEEFDLIDDGHAPIPSSSSPSVQKSEEPETNGEELELLEFEVVDKGVEIEDKPLDKRSTSNQVSREETDDEARLTRSKTLDLIAQRIKTLESMIDDEGSVEAEDERRSESLDTEEETVTKEFLHMLEEEEEEEEQNELKLDQQNDSSLESRSGKEVTEAEAKVFLPDLGKSLGCVVQTKDGGYLVSMNPFDIELPKKETPKLAMQVSKPLILQSKKFMSGLEIFQRMSAIGVEELSSEILSLMPLDELVGKTAEQVAFEGIAAAIIQGRNKEVANSRAARAIAAVKTMATTMSTSRKERISTGIWNVNKEPVAVDQILAFAMQKLEAMAIEALKIQADMTEEDSPFDVSPLVSKTDTNLNHPLAFSTPLEEWMKKESMGISDTELSVTTVLTISMVIQLRDPLREYEAVGGPMIALVQATCADANEVDDGDEERFKLVSLHVGGLKIKEGGKRHVWDAQKQRLTAMLWLVGHGLGKATKKGKNLQAKGPDSLWSISSRVMADMWLKQMRNPDIKFVKQQEV